MSDPRRLTEEVDGLEGSLLRAAKAYRPSERSKQATLVVVGAAAVAATASTATTATRIAAWKLGGLGVLVLVALGGVVYGVSGSRTAPLAKTNSVAVAEPAASVPVVPAPAVPAPAVAIEEPIASASVLPATSAPASLALAAPKPSVALSLSDEIKILDRARAALGSDPKGALAALDEHRRLFPKPNLGLEATVIRIDALVQAGQRAAAKVLAKDFLVRHPTSPQAARIRKLVGLDEGGSDAGT